MPGNNLGELFELFNYFLSLPLFFLDLLLFLLPDFKVFVVLFFCCFFSCSINKLNNFLISSFIVSTLPLDLKSSTLKF